MFGWIRRAALGAAMLLVGCASAVQAQTWPDRPIRFIAGTTAGSTADLVARVLGDGMSKVLGQSIVVENRPGADQIIAFEQVTRNAPADGYTVGVFGLDGQALLPLMKKNLRFDPMKDLTLVAGVGETRYVLVGPAAQPYRNFKELTDAVKAAPGKFNYGSSVLQVRLPSLEIMQNMGLDMAHIPYAGGGPYVTALVAGTIDWAIFGEGSTIPVKQRIRLYGITGKTRSVFNPDVPTFAELGHPRILGPGYALMVRAGTPQAIVDKLSAAAAAAIATAESKASAQKFQFDLFYETADGATRNLNERVKFYRDFFAKGLLKPDE